MESPTKDRLGELSAAGVSIWLDDLSRERIESGNLAELVKETAKQMQKQGLMRGSSD